MTTWKTKFKTEQCDNYAKGYMNMQLITSGATAQALTAVVKS